MAVTLQTREVLPMLTERGLRVNRESLAEMSDLLGLQARTTKANWSHRRWHPSEVELIGLAFRLRQDWGLRDEVLQELMADGPGCSNHLLERLRTTLGDFVAQAGAVADDRASGQVVPATNTAAA